MIVPAYTKQLSSKLPYRSIATLADEPAGLTCSVIVGTNWASGGSRPLQLRGYASFEQAADTVLRGENDVLLVAAAYPRIGRFFFHKHLQAETTFLTTLPDMVVCSRQSSLAHSFDALYYHPAIASRIPDVTTLYKDKVSVTSNSQAARLAADDTHNAAAVTNRVCADYFNLQITQTLATETAMSFVVFIRKV